MHLLNVNPVAAKLLLSDAKPLLSKFLFNDGNCGRFIAQNSC